MRHSDWRNTRGTLNRLLRRLLLSTLLWVLLSVSVSSFGKEKETVSAEQIHALKQRIIEVNRWLENAEGQFGELQQQLRESTQAVAQISQELRTLDKQQATLREQLSQLKNQQQQLNGQLAAQRGWLKAQVRAAWMQGDVAALKVLLNQSSPQDLARTLTYHQYLSQHTLAKLTRFQQTLAALENTEAQTSAAQVALTQARAASARKKTELKARQTERQTALAGLKKDMRAQRGNLTRLEADRQRLETLFKKIQAAAAEMSRASADGPFASLKSRLPWPAQGKITGRYGDLLAEGKMRRNGLLIHTDKPGKVIAVANGHVVFSNWLRGFGLLIIVDHGHGYMSLYGHNSSLLKNTGDAVLSGETLAMTGDSGETSETALYFEIRHKGEPENPLPWLRKQ